MTAIRPLIYRSVVLDREPLAFSTEDRSAFGNHKQPRLFVDSCTVFGVTIPKVLFAIDGGEDAKAVTSPTAACTLTEFHLCDPDKTANLSFTIRCPMNAELRDKLERAIEAVRSGESTDNTIHFGNWNSKQELKDDGVWAPAMQPPCGLRLVPATDTLFELSIGEGHFMGGSSANYELAPISGYNFKVDRTSLKIPAFDVVHASSTERGQYALINIDEFVFNYAF
ncbi:hypothetical protein M9194_06230 [Vibrio sp. S4M6]|uniref:type VI secretion system tube protein IglC n=1 Tax=Vibrio sinus TaxID=2946865 RepID=UPI00202A56BD|nr:type VI secretion system tube protein IglC [Vibrio sinus]MCL9781021.1 hypothetical protein [Vibrio sinus]